MALLEVRDLHVSYENPVLLGIDFEVEEGETAVLFGLNGAGKTTTVATIAGMLKPDKGTITFAGAEIGGRSPSKLVPMGVALVPEGRRVFQNLSVANNLRLGAWVRRSHARGGRGTASARVRVLPAPGRAPGPGGGDPLGR